MKYCPKCSKTYPDATNFCTTCGGQLTRNYNSESETIHDSTYDKVLQNSINLNNKKDSMQNVIPNQVPNSTTTSVKKESMGFFEAVKTCFKKYATFSGRARRSEYWWFCLFNTLIFLIIYLLAIISGLLFLSLLSSLYTLAVLIPSLAVSVRRMHDVGKSGAYILMALIPLVGGILVLIAELTDSEQKENQYGPCPK